MRSGRGDVTSADRGQSTVELALVLPFVMLVLLGVVQVGGLVRDQILVVHAAREAARAGAVTTDPAAPRRAAETGDGLDPGRLRVGTVRAGRTEPLVRAQIDYTSVTDLPLIGPLLPDIHLHADATMRIEQ
jgi:Flp pilus assembly protein TadG